MPRPFPVSRSAGLFSRQAHADLPAGTFERELGREGFFGAATHMYHPRPPTGWVSFEGDLRPRAYDLTRTEETEAGPWGTAPFLGNDHLTLRFWRSASSMRHLVRNADGDDLLFVHEGEADFYSDYGHLRLEAGDYVVIPRGTMWRTEQAQPFAALLIEAKGGAYGLPDRGLLGAHAIFDPAVLDVPEINDHFRAQSSVSGAWQVEVKRRDAISRVTYPYNPLDAVGWHGDLSPVRLNVRDIRPIVSHRYHLPPSVHSTFVTDRFIVCTFVPRPFETDPGAIKIPFFHNNDDYDEVIFYHAGDFFSRDNIMPGMVTFHPSGFTHGPHPKALRNMLEQKKAGTDEIAVMIDARDPLDPGTESGRLEIEDYADSWRAAP